jgi:hypothetical protein
LVKLDKIPVPIEVSLVDGSFARYCLRLVPWAWLLTQRHRGLGAELRTNAYGALRAGAGYLISSYAMRYTRQQRDAAGDNTAGIAHLSQAVNWQRVLTKRLKCIKPCSMRVIIWDC